MSNWFRKVGKWIWTDKRFRALSIEQKLSVMHGITFNDPREYGEFGEYVGPRFGISGGNGLKRRLDLCSAGWRRVRAEVIREQGCICRYCGEDCSSGPTVDHVIPPSKGGSSEKSNLVVSCRRCNSSKGDRILDGGSLCRT